MITAKVSLASKVMQGPDTPHESVQLTFGADYNDGRNKEWAKATPYLNLSMVVTPEVAERFEVGKPYTLQFIDGSAEAVPASRSAMTFGFGEALAALKAGQRVTRAGWNGKDMFVELQVPDEHSKMRRPYLYMRPVDGALVPWVASQSDLLAEDWATV